MTIQLRTWAWSIFLSGFLTLGAMVPVRAQDVKTPQQRPAMQEVEFDQEQIESFASAARQVHEIRSKWQSRLQDPANADKAQEMQTQAGAEMMSAVEGKGLTVETYNAIATAAQQNPELAQRIAKLMEQSP